MCLIYCTIFLKISVIFSSAKLKYDDNVVDDDNGCDYMVATCLQPVIMSIGECQQRLQEEDEVGFDNKLSKLTSSHLNSPSLACQSFPPESHLVLFIFLIF